MSLGGGRGCYAGQPHAFYCAKCRRTDRFRRWVDRALNGGRVMAAAPGSRYQATGLWRRQEGTGGNWHNWGNIAAQYRCEDCGHTGWSRHPDVITKLRAQQKEEAEDGSDK